LPFALDLKVGQKTPYPKMVFQMPTRTNFVFYLIAVL